MTYLNTTMAKTARIEARVQPDIHRLIKQAAHISGSSISEFIINSATAMAKKTIAQNQIIELSLEDQQNFANNLINPPKMNDAMKEAFALHRQYIKQS